MHEIVALVVSVILTAVAFIFLASAMWFGLILLAILVVGTAPLWLPSFVREFRAGLRERKAEHSKPKV